MTSTVKVREWRTRNPEQQAAIVARNQPADSARIAARYAGNPEVRDRAKLRARESRYRLKYGLTIAQYDKMFELQGGVCAICKNPPKRQALHVDHDHSTKRVRGLTCFPCNVRVGRDRKPEHAVMHRRIADYIESTFDGRLL